MSKLASRTCTIDPVAKLTQGSVDGLCAYYAGAMLLTTFFPEFERDLFVSPEQDPIFKSSRLRGRQTRRQLVASWVFQGSDLTAVADALAKLEGAPIPGTERRVGWTIEHRDKNKTKGTFQFISDLIEREGTPVLLGYGSGGLGDHAVLVKGVRLDFPGTRHELRWLLLADPAGDEKLHWDQLVGLGDGRLELAWVAQCDALRPDIVVKEYEANDRLQRLRRWRYWCLDDVWGWHAVDELLAATRARPAE